MPVDFCCYTIEELTVIADQIKTFKWSPFEVSFEEMYVQCVQNSIDCSVG